MLDKIKKIVGANNVLTDVPMSRFTTFHVGGNAAYLVNAENEESLTELLRLLKENGMPYYLLGNGSNLLVSDRGYDGVMIRLEGAFRETDLLGRSAENTESAVAEGSSRMARVGAAAMLTNVAQQASEEGLSGLEFAYGIPGTIGGAIVMNAGAYGGEMCQIVESVRLLDEELNIIALKGDNMEFGYRTSILKRKPYIVLSVELKLFPGKKEEILAKMNANMTARKEKQPLDHPSAGSTFKRPEGYFAGKLIQDAGLRGYRIGGAQVSEKHCGFVINTGNATAKDIYRLIRDIQNKVLRASGVRLDPEVILLGEFEDAL